MTLVDDLTAKVREFARDSWGEIPDGYVEYSGLLDHLCRQSLTSNPKALVLTMLTIGLSSWNLRRQRLVAWHPRLQ